MSQPRRWLHILALGLAVCAIVAMFGWPDAQPAPTANDDPLDRLFDVTVQSLADGGALYSTPIGETGVSATGELAVVLPYGTDPLYVTTDGVVLVSTNVLTPDEPLRSYGGYIAFDHNVPERYQGDVSSARLIADLVRIPWHLGSQHVTAEVVDDVTVKLLVDAPALGWRWASAPVEVLVTWSDESYAISFDGQNVTLAGFGAVPASLPAFTPVP